MLKFGKCLVCCLITFIPFIAAAESTLPVCLELTGQATGLTYENAHRTLWFNGNLALLLGMRFEPVTLGWKNDIDYYSYNTPDDAALPFKGGWFNIRSLLLTAFPIQPWLDLKMGLGGLWLRSSLNYNDAGWIGQNQFGFAALFNIGLNFPGWLAGLELQNKVDLLFADSTLGTDTLFNTYYYGGLRVNIRPGLSWLTLFTSLNILVWNSTTAVYEPNIWTVSMNLGFEMNWGATGGKKPGQNPLKADSNRTTDPSPRKVDKNKTKASQTDTNIKNTKNTDSTDTAVVSVRGQKDYESISPGLKLLNESGPGKAINFPELVFVEGETELLPGAQPVLDAIAEILTARDNLIIAIAGYTEIFNEPEKEISVASSRAQFIKQYLAGKGIKKNRLKINPVTHFAFPNSKTRIVISIIDFE